MKVAATLTVNGIAYPVELDPATNLLAAVRDVIGLTGSKEGCDDSECGACMMLLDGRPVNSCSYHPAPMPQIRRPPEITSMFDVILARSPGFR